MIALTIWTIVLLLFTAIYFSIALSRVPASQVSVTSSKVVSSCIGGFASPLLNIYQDLIAIFYSYASLVSSLNILLQYTIHNATLYIVNRQLIFTSVEDMPQYSYKEFKFYSNMHISIPTEAVLELYSEGQDRFFLTLIDSYMSEVDVIYSVGTYACIPALFTSFKYQKQCKMFSIYPIIQGSTSSMITCYVSQNVIAKEGLVCPGAIETFSSYTCDPYNNTFYSYLTTL